MSKKSVPPVEVEWEDPWRLERLSSLEEVKHAAEAPNLFRSVGWIIHRNRARLCLASSYDPDDGTYRGVLMIPLCLVRRVRRLRYGR